MKTQRSLLYGLLHYTFYRRQSQEIVGHDFNNIKLLTWRELKIKNICKLIFNSIKYNRLNTKKIRLFDGGGGRKGPLHGMEVVREAGPRITSGESTTIESKSNKPVTIALEEIAQGKLGYYRTRSGIK